MEIFFKNGQIRQNLLLDGFFFYNKKFSSPLHPHRTNDAKSVYAEYFKLYNIIFDSTMRRCDLKLLKFI